MVPIPPPPDFGPADIPPPPPPGPDVAGAHPRPGELTLGWRWVLVLGWISVVVGLIAVADASRVIHKPPFWTDPGYLVAVPFLLPVLTSVAAFTNDRRMHLLAGASVAVLCACAVVDRSSSPGIAAALGVLALIGLLTSVSSIAGRMPRPRA